MGLLKKIGYEIKRFLRGEEGIVEAVDGVDKDYLLKDYFGGFPQMVTIINPLGNRVRLPSPMGLTFIKDRKGIPLAIREYKTYAPGERYP